jgi:hypothetical protein
MERWRGHIERALAHSGGTHIFEDVYESVMLGRMQLWENNDSMLITEIVVYPRKKTLHIFLASGTMDDVLDVLPSVEAWGRIQGCEAVTFAGRKGWLRVMTKRGYSSTLAVMEKGL